jgi:ribosome-associated protein
LKKPADLPNLISRKRAAAPEKPPTLSPLESDLAKTILMSLDDAKADDVVALDCVGRTTLADVMVVATGRSSTHVGAIADRILKACREGGFRTPRVEGQPVNDWVLIDAGDVIVHVFRPDIRQFYNLEKMWGSERPAEPLAAAH